jgi:two-component system CheB/CheR fusion protein
VSDGSTARPANSYPANGSRFFPAAAESSIWRNNVVNAKSPKRRARRPAENAKVIPIHSGDEFLIVAIGASAGGIEATTALVRSLAPDTGMAFIVVQHLDPKHHSILSELLAKETTMSVSEVTDRMRVEPNHIYVIPPDATMSISDHVLRLTPREESRVGRMPIDYFMRSLAEAHSNSAIGVVLSGTGSDGTLGLAEIQAQGGVTLVQDETTAKYDGMPRSAIASGAVDFILPPEGIARELERIAKHPYAALDRAKEPAATGLQVDGIESIFQVLRRATGVDFTHYRQSTIRRRIHRRMIVHKIDRLADYVKYVLTNPPEVKALYQDMLINVTSFFRNPKVFEAIETHVFPNILKHRQPNSTIRLWTPACSSGEETYSVAIALLEFLGDRAQEIPVQIFGTDISEPSINKARTAWYPENIAGDVSPERLRRFFNKADGGYRISKAIRDMCIFAQHNVLSDPPFSQMDLICCRNLLIYLEPILQNRVISLFHYAIRNHGYLVLGSSEGVGASGNLFATDDRTHRIFSKKATAARQPVTFSMGRQMERADFGPANAGPKVADTNWNYLEAQKEFDRRLLAQYSPAAAFVNEDMDLIHTRGNVGRYLKLAPGRASLNILKMAREGLLLELRNALTRAKKDRTNVRRQGIELKNGNGNGNGHAPGAKDVVALVNFEVIPITMGNVPEPYYMIIFSEAPPLGTTSGRSQKAIRESESAGRRIAKLEQELASTKEYLQSVIETQEATNEELQSANEEVLSSNEELQSTNEELETAKEELQSANEELATVNDELRDRNNELSRAHKDLSNLFTSIGMAILMIGSDLKIRRFTPQAQKIFGLIPGDVGRPLSNINPHIDVPNLQQTIVKVMSSSAPVDTEVADQQGARFFLRVFPYPVADGRVDGVVLTMVPVPQGTKPQERA